VRRHALLWLLLFAAYATTVGLRAAAGRPLSAVAAHELAVARSITAGGPLALRPQGIGFPLLIAPAHAIGGRVLVELWLATLAAAGYVAAAAIARRLVPDPWATGAALATGLSPPALVASTTIAPDAVAASALAGAALLALRARDAPRQVTAAWCGTLLALLPWLGLRYCVSGAVIAIALLRWCRRRQRAIVGLVGLEVALFSAVLYLSIDDRVYGGLTAYAALSGGVSPTGAHGLGNHLARSPRLLGLWGDPHAGVLLWAPFPALALAGAWLLVRSRREQLAVAVPGQADADAAGGMLAAACGAQVVAAAFLVPTIAGPWFAGHELVCVLPLAAGLAALGLRRFPRTGTVLAALTIALSVWIALATRFGSGTGVAPPRGLLPWA